jgi:hypothetical protein
MNSAGRARTRAWQSVLDPARDARSCVNVAADSPSTNEALVEVAVLLSATDGAVVKEDLLARGQEADLNQCGSACHVRRAWDLPGNGPVADSARESRGPRTRRRQWTRRLLLLRHPVLRPRSSPVTVTDRIVPR